MRTGAVTLFGTGMEDWEPHWHRELKCGRRLKNTEEPTRYGSCRNEEKNQTNVIDEVREGWAAARFGI